MIDRTVEDVELFLKRVKQGSEKHVCANCFHYQEFRHCSCREESDIERRSNMCPDWRCIEHDCN